MRKFELVMGTMAIIVIGVSTGVYLSNRAAYQDTGLQLATAPPEPQKVISPSEVISKPVEQGLTVDQQETTATASGDSATTPARRAIFYPKCKAGSTRIVAAQAITSQSEFIKPIWSPTALDIAFTKSDLSGIYLAGPEQFGEHILTAHPKAGSDFRWNADGMSLRIVDPDDEPVDLMVTGEKYPALKQQSRVLKRNDVIYYRTQESSAHMSISSIEGRVVTPGTLVKISGPQDRFYAPQLSPDGSKILFLGTQTGIYIAFLDDSPTVRIGKGRNPTWLPDSSGIVYDVAVNDGLRDVDGDLWYASVDGRECTNLTNTPGILESHPNVAPDCQHIAFSNDGAIFVGQFVRD